MRRFIKSSEAWTLRLGLIVCAAGWIQGCSDGPGARSRYQPGFDEQLAHDTGVSWTVVTDPDYGTPSFLEPQDPAAPSLAPGENPESAAREFFKKYSKQLGIGDPDRELVLEETGTDGLGMPYAAFLQQTLAGTPVFGTRLTAHYAADGSIAYIAGRFAPNAASVSATPSLTNDQAIAVASAKLLSEVSGADPNTLEVTQTPSLLVYAPNATTASLAYEVAVSVSGPAASGDKVYVVDATTGSILFDYGAAHTLAASGHGALYYPPVSNLSDPKKSFEVKGSLSEPPYVLQRDGTLITSPMNANQPKDLSRPAAGTDLVRSTDINAWDVLGKGSAVDAYYYFAQIDHHYRKVHGRQSYDNKNAPIKIVVHDSRMTDNGAWIRGAQLFRFGDAGGTATSLSLPFTADLDMCAHEFQHAVTQHTLGLVYQNESGALNESISDMFGCFVEHAIRPGPNNTKLADLSVAPGYAPLRDMAAPATRSQPDHVTKQYRGPNDAGGVHINSGIPNNAWYLMTIGGKNPISQITVQNPLGWQKSEKLWYAVLQSKSLAGRATFKDVALVSTAKAKALPNAKDLKQGPVHTVACSWLAVGVLTQEDLQKNWKVTCDLPPGGLPDAGAAPSPGTTPDAGDSDADNTAVAGDCTHNPCETGAALGKQCSSCTGQICLTKPECCDASKSWTADCVTAAQNLQGACASVCYDGQSSCTHSECSAGDALPSSCSTCAAAVCKLDQFCCTNKWDQWCVNEAERSPYCSCNA